MVNVSTNVLSLSVLLDKVYLVKVPYTAFATAKDTDTQNFLAGLEEKYGTIKWNNKRRSQYFCTSS